MAWAFPIGNFVGFNLEVCEEVLFLESYRTVKSALPPGVTARFEVRFFEQCIGVHENVIRFVNRAIRETGAPEKLIFLPKLTDWKRSDYMRAKDETKPNMRNKIWNDLQSPATRAELIAKAKTEFENFPDPIFLPDDQERLFNIALQRLQASLNGEPCPTLVRPNDGKTELVEANLSEMRRRAAAVAADMWAPPITKEEIAAADLARLDNALKQTRVRRNNIEIRLQEIVELEELIKNALREKIGL